MYRPRGSRRDISLLFVGTTTSRVSILNTPAGHLCPSFPVAQLLLVVVQVQEVHRISDPEPTPPPGPDITPMV
ncbi:MAG: hypothetical protein MK210_12365 [Dehalococcoidia bacterium]|nr:hypothetical protein [Dehalococcoidia bacterium]